MLSSSSAAACSKPLKTSTAPKLPKGPGKRTSSFLLKKSHDGDLLVGSAGGGCPFLRVLLFFLWFFLHGRCRLFGCSWRLGLGKVILAVGTGLALVNLLRHWLKEKKNKWKWLSLRTEEQRPPPCMQLSLCIFRNKSSGFEEYKPGTGAKPNARGYALDPYEWAGFLSDCIPSFLNVRGANDLGALTSSCSLKMSCVPTDVHSWAVCTPHTAATQGSTLGSTQEDNSCSKSSQVLPSSRNEGWLCWKNTAKAGPYHQFVLPQVDKQLPRSDESERNQNP